MGRWHIVTGPFASSAPQTDMKISWLPTIAAAAVISTVIRAAAFTPLEAKQGAAQKIFYIHVPAAWVAFLAFFLVAVSSGVYLWLRDARLDRFAESSAEVGVVFTTVVLLTLMLSLGSFTLLYFAFLRSRYRYATDRDAVAAAIDHDA